MHLIRPPLLLFLLLLTGCVIHERAEGILELDPDLTNGLALYQADCDRCHGEDGRGSDSGPNIVTELHHGDAYFVTQILNGVGAEMPAYDDYTDQEAADVLGHIHALADQ
jgi:mono/diheme cytochrome c family protein